MNPFFEKACSFLRKFSSLILALIMAVITLLYVIGAGRVITLTHSMGKSGFAHFLGIIFAIITVIGYIALHFVPRKAYRLLYALTCLFILTMFLVAHSLGLSAPVVTDCNKLKMIDYRNLANISSLDDLGKIIAAKDDDNSTVVIGTLGQRVYNCMENELLFAAAFINLILYVIALFDVQMVLLSRVKSKTYGERFVEMGISN